ncbi:MAG: TraB/GumN family protein, partial [Burkholderiales bacterium]|nr:TraB/GumN family protein [Burkholderiales bacterium]
EVIFDPAMLQTLAGRMLYADGRDLPQVAGAELFEKAAAAAGDLGLPPGALRLFRPWAVAMLLIMPRPQHGDVLDVVLMKRAQQQGKPVHQLETADEQIALFENLPERDQVMMLRHTVDNLETARRGVREVVEAWLARDLAALARISERDDIADPEVRRFNRRFRAELIDGRNARMLQRMRPRLEAGGFIAVGALHLHGPQGLLAQLAGLGYAVIREY